MEQHNLVQEDKISFIAILGKLSRKEELTLKEREKFEMYRNCIVGSVASVSFFYLTPPFGFGALFCTTWKGLCAAAGTVGVFELMRNYSWEDIKEKADKIIADFKSHAEESSHDNIAL